MILMGSTESTLHSFSFCPTRRLRRSVHPFSHPRPLLLHLWSSFEDTIVADGLLCYPKSTDKPRCILIQMWIPSTFHDAATVMPAAYWAFPPGDLGSSSSLKLDFNLDSYLSCYLSRLPCLSCSWTQLSCHLVSRFNPLYPLETKHNSNRKRRRRRSPRSYLLVGIKMLPARIPHCSKRI